MSLIEQIYDGGFYPCETIVPKDPEYRSKCQAAYDEVEYISGLLDETGKAHLEKFLDLRCETDYMSEYANFAFGLRTGARLMLELFMDRESA